MTQATIDTGCDQLLCTVADRVAWVTLNDPKKRNPLSQGVADALARVLDTVERDGELRVLVLTGAGQGFCSGGDISEMGRSLAGGGPPDPDRMVQNLRAKQQAVLLRLHEFAKPTIAALPGPAAGAGMGLALACDLRIAADTAALVPAFGAIGVSGDFGGSWLLSALIGPSRTKALYFTNGRLTAAEALALGAVNKVVPPASLAAETAALAAGLAAAAPIAIRAMKENINRAATTDLRTALHHEAAHMIRCLLTEDHRQAAQAFFDKRKPVFHGN